MELKAIKNFQEHEVTFRERSGNDFTYFYEKYKPGLIFNLQKFCDDPEKVKDVTSMAFMTAWEKIDKYHSDKAQFSTWLFTIARNLMLQDMKTSKKTISMDKEIDEDGTTLKDFLPEDEDYSYLNDLSEKKAEIMKRQIAQLKEPYRTVIEMRELKKMQYKDIAETLNKNLSTVKSQIRNGRAILISQTKREFNLLDDMYM